MKKEITTTAPQPTLSEVLRDAALNAAGCVAAIQRAHFAACVDKPTATQRLAEAQLLSLLADAVKLRDALKGAVS